MGKGQVVIRREAPSDVDDVREVNVQAFGGPVEARIVDALRASPGAISLVAVAGDRVVGHIFFTPVSLDADRPLVRVAGLGPMAVRPAFQRAGVGSALVRRGIEECRRHGYAAVVVLGHRRFYPRFGFRPAGAWGLVCEYPVPPEAFMAIELDPGSLDGRSGRVRYSPEFST
jgi:putative acetyltransferase